MCSDSKTPLALLLCCQNAFTEKERKKTQQKSKSETEVYCNARAQLNTCRVCVLLTLLVCYATYADVVKLVQMWGGKQYSIHSLCNLCR